MTDESTDHHVKTLEAMRERAIKSRRELADKLAAQEHDNPQLQDDFVALQALIDAIKLAIEQERQLMPKPKTKTKTKTKTRAKAAARTSRTRKP
jgi:hypothetical protein